VDPAFSIAGKSIQSNPSFSKESAMGRGRKQKTNKMKMRKRQSKLKARRKKVADAKRATRR
jgi:hypothetical protein